jgi:hypothetical protein
MREKKKSAEPSSSATEKLEEKQVDRPHSSGIQRASVASMGSKAKKVSRDVSGDRVGVGREKWENR